MGLTLRIRLDDPCGSLPAQNILWSLHQAAKKIAVLPWDFHCPAGWIDVCVQICACKREKPSCKSQLRNSLQRNYQHILIIHNNTAPKKDPERNFEGFREKGFDTFGKEMASCCLKLLLKKIELCTFFVDRVASITSSSRNNLQDLKFPASY